MPAEIQFFELDRKQIVMLHSSDYYVFNGIRCAVRL